MKKFVFLCPLFLFQLSIAQNVGIGTTTPIQKLHVVGNAYFNGNVGIGFSNPSFPLSFGQQLGDKISLWSSSVVSYGFGIQSLLFQIHTDGPGAAIAFGYGSSASFTENMRIKGNGYVGIGTSNPVAMLQVTGDVQAGFLRTANLAVTATGNAFDFLMRQNSYGDVAFRKGHGACAVNFIICIDGVFPVASGARPQYDDAITGKCGCLPVMFHLWAGLFATGSRCSFQKPSTTRFFY